MYLLDVASGAELRVNGVSTGTADETWPTVWRDRIAFVRSYDNKPTLPYIYARPLAGGSSQRLPGGSRKVCTRTGRRLSCTDERVSRPYALDLYGSRLAFGWTYAGRSEGLDTEIRLDTLGGGHARIAYQRGGGLTGRALGWPAFESGRVYFSTACYADTSGCVAPARAGALPHQQAHDRGRRRREGDPRPRARPRRELAADRRGLRHRLPGRPRRARRHVRPARRAAGVSLKRSGAHGVCAGDHGRRVLCALCRAPSDPRAFRSPSARLPDGVLVAVAGELDLATSAAFEATLLEQLAAGPVRLDMQGLSFMDSTGIRILDAILRDLPMIGSTLLIDPNLQPAVRQVIALTGMTDALPFDAPATSERAARATTSTSTAAPTGGR